MTTTFDPFREMDRFFGSATRTPAATAMPMDLFRNGETFVARIDLPGVDPDSIDVDVEDRTMTVRAHRQTEADKGVQWLSHERPSGTFARQLTLGYGVALDRIEAQYADGVLTLTIPVAEEAKARKITVAHAGDSRTIVGEKAESTSRGSDIDTQ